MEWMCRAANQLRHDHVERIASPEPVESVFLLPDGKSDFWREYTVSVFW
jgi:hypothetical protein